MKEFGTFFSSLEKIFETHGGGKSVAVCTISQLRQGTKALKASQVYPRGYGKEVARLHLSYIVARIQHDDDMGKQQCFSGKVTVLVVAGVLSFPRQRTKELSANAWQNVSQRSLHRKSC
jgi:hypothetical protein